MRIAIISSPRSGNTWVRFVLARAFQLNEVAVHDYLDAVALPERCILQCHWYREPHFQSFLKEHGFKPLIIARHPLDVLLSVLHFVRHESATQKWLLGNCELPLELATASSVSIEFERYCLSWGAENLLSVTYQWWHDAQAIRVKYEDLVASPHTQFSQLAELCGAGSANIAGAVAEAPFARLQSSSNHHGWRGTPGHWSTLVPRELALAVYDRHRRLFDVLGYDVGIANANISSAQEAWNAVVIPTR